MIKKILIVAIMVTTYANSETKTDLPDYYKDITPIQLKDVMYRYFGSNKTGILTYNFEDAGKTSGHVCPAVTGAFLMTREGLNALKEHYKTASTKNKITSYDAESGLIYRGGIKITMSGKADTGGAANAIAHVMSSITGAESASGFKNGPDFPFANRRHLLNYDPSLVFSPKTGIEAIFTSMTATYEKKDKDEKWQSASFEDCKGTWGDCREITQCDKSVKVSYHFKSPDIIGKDPKAEWTQKIKNIIDNADKAIKVEPVANPKVSCE